MAHKHMKRCLVSLVIREMQDKTIMRYHFIFMRMAIVKKTDVNKFWGGCGESRTFIHCWRGCEMVHLLWKTDWQFLKKLNIELPYDPAILLLGIHPRKIKAYVCTKTCT